MSRSMPILAIHSSTRSLQSTWKQVFRDGTDTNIKDSRHCDLETESAQWANSVKIINKWKCVETIKNNVETNENKWEQVTKNGKNLSSLITPNIYPIPNANLFANHNPSSNPSHIHILYPYHYPYLN